jgi:hypothetical protein
MVTSLSRSNNRYTARICPGTAAAEHAHAADRFAREIVPFLKLSHGALAVADGQPVRRQLFLFYLRLGHLDSSVGRAYAKRQTRIITREAV